jgi:hypothetical protein
MRRFPRAKRDPSEAARVRARLLIWGGYAASLAAYALLSSLWQAEPVPFVSLVLCWAIAALCLLPLFVWRARGSQGMPMFELICLAYMVAFSLPVFMQRNEIFRSSRYIALDWQATQGALILVALGIVTMLCGYYLLQWGAVKRMLPRVDLPLSSASASLYINIGLLAGLAMMAAETLGRAPLYSTGWAALIRLCLSQFHVALVLLANKVFSNSRTTYNAVLLFGSVALSFLMGLSMGFLEISLLPITLLFIVRWHAMRRFPWGFAAAGLALFLILSSVKGAYRNYAWYGAGPTTMSEKLRLWSDLAWEAADEIVTSGGVSEVEQDLRLSMSRFDLLHNFVEVTQMTPKVIPFYNGETYSFLLYAWIPRALWPDKPNAYGANSRLAVDYGMMLESQTTATQMGIGHLPEAYANFGLVGVALIMALQGIVFSGLDVVLNRTGSEGGRAVYVATMVYFLNGIGSATAGLFAGAFVGVVSCAIVLRFFSRGWSRPRYMPVPARLGFSPAAGRPRVRQHDVR